MVSRNELKLVRQLEQKKYRRLHGLFVAEGRDFAELLDIV